MHIFERKERCSGCRACEKSCPEICISMEPDAEGFLYPVIDSERCIDCEICIDICNHEEEVRSQPRAVYAAYSKNDEIRLESSSGGVFFCLAEKVIKNNGLVFGAAFDENLKVIHIGVDSIEGLKKLKGSKYVQSDTLNTYVEAQEALERGVKVLYSGTPCQIDGLKRFLKKDYEKLVCLSVICHGVPSPLIWERYLKSLEGDFGEKIEDVHFREKPNGSWRENGVLYRFKEKEFLYAKDGEPYMKGFLQDIFLRPSCYECKAKREGVQGDIVLGDFWGVENFHPDIDGYKGVSTVIINSEHGERLFEEIKECLFVKESSYDAVLAGNPMLEKSTPCPSSRERFWEEFNITGRILESIQDNVRNIPMSKEERSAFLYPIMMKYLSTVIEGELLTKTLLEHGIKRVLLYSVTEFTDLILKENEKRRLVEIVAVADQNYKKLFGKYDRCPIISPDELLCLYKDGKADGVVVCSPIHANVIIDWILKNGIEETAVFSIIQLLY